MEKLDALRESASLIFQEFEGLHFNGIEVSFEGKKVDMTFTKKMYGGWFQFITIEDGTEINLCIDKCDSEEKLKDLINNAWRVM